ncbi:hypothetical protein ACFY36_30275 [Actinoplanes sp. NPDC000266]
MTDPYATFEDRVVAEFGDGHDVEGIAARYGLTVAQVYAIVEREVGPAAPPAYPPPPPGYYAPHRASRETAAAGLLRAAAAVPAVSAAGLPPATALSAAGLLRAAASAAGRVSPARHPRLGA